MSNQLNFAISLLKLTLARNDYNVHAEQRDTEALLHVYPAEYGPVAEALFFVRVQACKSVEEAQMKHSGVHASMYGKPVYLAQLVNYDFAFLSTDLENKMLYTRSDIKRVELVN